ncbi:MAG: hybrid sensor histidine kinase/response regulator [Bacteroidetes bacterium]|nr:hybrid sensor histidine kinase/response regulator [Bacteroidota bacterium]
MKEKPKCPDTDKAIVLIIDDMEANLTVVGMILNEANFDLRYATSAKQAMEIIDAEKPQIILMDIIMPEISGIELCKILKEKPETEDIPVIFLTALPETNTILKAFEAGGVDYITKPFNNKELIKRIMTHLEISCNRKRNLEQNHLLSEQNEELKMLNKLRDKLTALISHDLRSPLVSIIGFSDILISDIDSFSKEEVTRFLTLINQSAYNAGMLLENMLAWSRTQMKYIQPQPSLVCLPEITEESLRLMRPSALIKNISISTHPDSKCIAYCDHNLVSTIIRNLLSNAIKFTPEGGNIEIGFEKCDGYAEMYIKDNGVGIEEEILKKIRNEKDFSPRSGTSGEKGTGLGMMIVKEFIDLSGGKLLISSKINQGSEFRIQLPTEKEITDLPKNG